MGLWVDYWFLLVFGGIPWQCYYQRVLSSKTANRAMFLSYGGAAIALIMTGQYLAMQEQMINDYTRSVCLVWSNRAEHGLDRGGLPLRSSH